ALIQQGFSGDTRSRGYETPRVRQAGGGRLRGRWSPSTAAVQVNQRPAWPPPANSENVPGVLARAGTRVGFSLDGRSHVRETTAKEGTPMTRIGPKCALWSLALGAVLAGAPVLAAPGDAFGGDDTGCVPSTKPGLGCAKKVSGVLVKLRKSILGCHLTQAELTFRTGMATNGSSNAEDNCQEGNP